MDGRLVIALLVFGLPLVLLWATVAYFASNPVSIFVLFGVMVGGGLYLATYSDATA